MIHTFRISMGLLFMVLLCIVESNAQEAHTEKMASGVNDVLVYQLMDSMRIHAAFNNAEVNHFKAKTYLKGNIKINKINFLFRHIPNMFRSTRGVNEYLLEIISNVDYQHPNIFKQRVQKISGTLRDERNIPGFVDYLQISPYAESLAGNRFLSPLSKRSYHYYHFHIDSIATSASGHTLYYVSFAARTKSVKLVDGDFALSDSAWTIESMHFKAKYEMLHLDFHITMGKANSDERTLPVRYDVDVKYRFVGNKIDGKYTAIIKYDTIAINRQPLMAQKKKYNLTAAYELTTDNRAFERNRLAFDTLRPVPLLANDLKIYQDYDQRKVSPQKHSKTQRYKVFWSNVGDFFLDDYNWRFAQNANVRCSPFMNPLAFSYSASNGISYRQDFRYYQPLRNETFVQVSARLGYNFKYRDFYWNTNTEWLYNPRRIGMFRLTVGNGNRIYSSAMLDEINSIPDSLFKFSLINLDFFKSLHVGVSHSAEICNGLSLELGVNIYKRWPIATPKWVLKENQLEVKSEENTLPPPVKENYTSFAPRFKVTWTPRMYYYINGQRKINLYSYYPTLSYEYERGIKNVFNSSSTYERMEFDLQHQLNIGLLRTIYYRFGMGMFTKEEDTYFVDFANFRHNNLPRGWNDDLGGDFQLLDSRWYNASRRYVRSHLTYESPFLFLRHILGNTSIIQNERFYMGALYMQHLNPYIEMGYGVGTHIIDIGVFVSCKNWEFNKVGCKFTIELFN